MYTLSSCSLSGRFSCGLKRLEVHFGGQTLANVSSKACLNGLSKLAWIAVVWRLSLLEAGCKLQARHVVSYQRYYWHVYRVHPILDLGSGSPISTCDEARVWQIAGKPKDRFIDCTITAEGIRHAFTTLNTQASCQTHVLCANKLPHPSRLFCHRIIIWFLWYWRTFGGLIRRSNIQLYSSSTEISTSISLEISTPFQSIRCVI